MVRIFLVEDNAIMRAHLRAALEKPKDWTVVGEAVNGWEGVEEAQRLRPDLAIMDLNMPELGGVEATREIVKAVPQCAVLVLTEHDSVPLVCEALEAGAKGFLPKSDIRQLVSTVRTTLAG